MEEPNNTTPAPETENGTPAVELPIPSKTASFFSESSRFGKFARTLVRTLAVGIGLAALGALAVFLLMVRPLEQSQEKLMASATQTAGDLTAREAELTQARKDLKDASERLEGIQSNLNDQQAEVNMLRAVVYLSEAQIAMFNEDTQAASKAVNSAEQQLKSVLERIDKADKPKADSIRALLTLTKTDIDRDPQLFSQDVERLKVELEMIEKVSP